MPDVEFRKDSFKLYGDAEEKDIKSFNKDCFQSLYELAFSPPPDLKKKGKARGKAKEAESYSFAYLRKIAAAFLNELKNTSGIELLRQKTKVLCPDEVADELVKDAPFALGAEYIDRAWMENAFEKLTAAFATDIERYNGTVADYFSGKIAGVKIPERVFFHLVEHKEDNYPFAFMATYATQTDDGSVRHMPLNYALTEYKQDSDKLVGLLSCLNQAAAVSEFISRIVESGEMFHPLKLTAAETYEFLKNVGEFEKAGILCRVPNWWRKKTAGVRLAVKIGGAKKKVLGLNTILTMKPMLTVDGAELTQKDIKTLLASTEGLAYLKGKWIDVNKDKLKDLLSKIDEYDGDVSLLSALRTEAGLNPSNEEKDAPEYIQSDWLKDMMAKLRSPKDLPPMETPKTVRAKLRPYQKDGFNWLCNMTSLGFGACLADDMGLGKTLQTLTFLEVLREKNKDARILLIVPATLLANWTKEAKKFVPTVTMHTLHGRKKEVLEEELNHIESMVTVTTYQMATRLENLQKIKWDGIILDEAQAIKNPGTKQTKTIKKIPAKFYVAMTGTPIENDLGNLWSLFDFLNRGLLGSVKEFSDFAKTLADSPAGYGRLKEMVAPFILRRVKTDKNIIADLPDKIEQIDYVSPGKKQIILYRKEVADLEAKLASPENEMGIRRQGLVLAAITKLKQICNHPDQFLGNSVFKPEDSGKFLLLKEICEVIREKRERALIFTQYKEMTKPLSNFLEQVFGQKGLVIHGSTPVKKRPALVEEFNAEDYVPFMVLSVKAAGTGLNLTAANHVIHFDRWWNPAVENQATDRAFRIGQKKNVTVHKFVTEGTIEERIDEIISEKTALANDIIGDGAALLTQMSNEDLIKLLKFDITNAEGGD